MGVYLKSIAMFIKSEMEYKVSFFLTMLGSALNTLFAFLRYRFFTSKVWICTVDGALMK